jgi:hypothetical protein
MKGLTDLNTLTDPLNQTSNTDFSDVFLKIKEDIDTKDSLTVDTLKAIFNSYKSEIRLIQAKLEIISSSIDQIAAKTDNDAKNAGINCFEFLPLSLIAGIIAVKKKRRKN